MIANIYPQTRWSLSDLFPGSESAELQNALANIAAQVADFEKQRERLVTDIEPGVFLGIILKLEAITHLVHRLYGFAGLWFTEDTQNQAAQTLQARVQQFMAEMTNRTLFFSLWWKHLDDTNAERLLAHAGNYRYWLEEMRHFKPHTLSEPEEKIINLKDVTGSSAINRLYDAITNRYVFELEIGGEKKRLTRGELMVYVREQDPALRARAYQELYRVYAADGPILGQMYQTLVRDWRTENVDLRRYATPIAARNLVNDIPDAVIDLLLDVCQTNFGVFQRFFRLKARVLGMERLRRYDIYAPVTAANKSYAFGEGVAMTLDAFREFEPRVAQLAERVFAENHMDSEVRKGKRSGAFCWGVAPDLTPWVLVNYQGRANDVSTVAHELGHAVHSMLAAHQSIFSHHASLPLAETASTFGEMLLVDRLLAQESDEAVRRDILFQQVDDAYATIMRQSFFALFERQAHELIHANANVEQLAAAYLDNLRSQFGDAVEVGEEFRWEWVSIPHIYHTPFYVYAYTFGQLLVLALYQQYKAEGESFKPRYMSLLSAGGSQAPVDILSAAGIDIYSRAFWQGGFDVVTALIEQLEAMG